MTAQLFEDALRNEGIEAKVIVEHLERKEATEITAYFDLRSDRLCVISETGEIDVSRRMRMDFSTDAEDAADAVELFLHSLLADLADLILTVPPENTKDALLHNVGRGRVIPRDFARTHLKRLLKDGGKPVVAGDSPFRNESWFPND